MCGIWYDTNMLFVFCPFIVYQHNASAADVCLCKNSLAIHRPISTTKNCLVCIAI